MDDVAVEMDDETAAIVVNSDEEDAVLRGGEVIVLEEDWVGRVVVWDLMRRDGAAFGFANTTTIGISGPRTYRSVGGRTCE
uniref:Uncharacterized protein n=1 Tax=Fagus sylvatica TaxID=28930 RepID=A0A2N9EMR7_FAGSY